MRSVPDSLAAQLMRWLVDKYSQTALSEASGILQSEVSRFVNLQRKAGRDDAWKAHQALGIRMEWWKRPPVAQSTIADFARRNRVKESKVQTVADSRASEGAHGRGVSRSA